MFSESVLCIILENNIALNKICSDHIINHLIKDLSRLKIAKLLVGNFPSTYESPIPRIDCSLDDVDFLEKIKNHSKAKNIILLPAHFFRCQHHTFKRILFFLGQSEIVIASKRNSKNKIIALNCNNLTGNKTVSDFVKTNTKIEKVIMDGDECFAIDNARKLIDTENTMQKQLREKAINRGVFLLGENKTYLSFDTKIAPGVTIYPNVFLGPEVVIEEGASILSFSHLEGVNIGQNAVIGPFARIRKETTIKKNSVIGNFVEIKNSKISEGVKIKHLSYIGDTKIGSRTNIGAGVVVCNYDGSKKHETTIGQGCFIGGNSCLISPLYITENVKVAAGSTITDDIKEKSSLAIARSRQVIKKVDEHSSN